MAKKTLAGWEATFDARGFTYLTNAERDRIVNDAARAVIFEHDWPFRLTSQGGAAPLTLAYGGRVSQVMAANGVTELRPIRRDEVVGIYGASPSGSAERYYVDHTTGVPRIVIVPNTGETITVWHYQRKLWTSGGLVAASSIDTLTLPEDWEAAVEERIVAECYRENDEHELAQTQITGIYAEKLQDMVDELLGETRADEPGYVRLHEGWG